MRKRFDLHLTATLTLLAALALPACATQSDSAPYAATPASSEDDGISRDVPAYAKQLKGTYDLWQDGEGGLSCKITLGDQPTLGGLTVQADQDCAEKLALEGDPYAWFINDEEKLIIIDAARQALLRMETIPDGSYKDRRDGDYVNAVLLTRP
jgi:hypothetical protein